MKGRRKPRKKPFGREGPPKGYPKDQSLYADPENWRYPLHTPWHARAARRYFDEWLNRSKYTKEEQAYVDWRIDEALKKFGRPGAEEKRKRAAQIPIRMKGGESSLNDLLELSLGAARFKRISEIDDSLVSILDKSPDQINGKIKNYAVRIDIKNRTISHDCQDWRNNMANKMLCKHLGKFLLTLDQKTATDILQDIFENKDQWSFVAP